MGLIMVLWFLTQALSWALTKRSDKQILSVNLLSKFI
jgi:hypothetical protein